MEKKRSPRSSKSPGSSIFPKSPLVYDSYKSGCGWKLINLFDFRHVKSGNNKRLCSDKKKFIKDSAGNVYTKSQLDLLKKLHQKCQCNGRIVEGESSCKPKTRRRSLSCERVDDNYESKPVQGLLERELKRIKNLKKETCSSPDQLNQSSLSETEYCKKMAETINLQVCVNEAAETLICSKAEEKGKDMSKKFMEALDILSSNKELFITLLQDPNSFSARKGQDFEGSAKVKEPSTSTSNDDLDEIVVLKPILSSSVDNKAYLRFKHLSKKVKLVVGSNKDINHAEIKPECSGKAREAEAGAFRTTDITTESSVGHKSPESPVFRRQKRVESDVFKLNIDNDVLPRRFTVEKQQERSNSSPVYEVPNALSSLQTKLKERRQKLEKRRERFKLWSLDNNLEVFDPNPHNSNLRSLVEYGIEEDRYLESSSIESNMSLERRETNIKQEQEQPSPVSVLERIHLEDEAISKLGKSSSLPGDQSFLHGFDAEQHVGLLCFDDPNMDHSEKESVYEFVKKVIEASRLNWTNLMERCSEEISLLDEFSHDNHNSDKLLLLDYTDEILREVYRQDIMFWPFTPTKSLRIINLSPFIIDRDLIDETMRRVDWSLLCFDSLSATPRTLDEIIETDMRKPCLWLGLGGESEGVVSDVVEKIMQQLVLEISHEL
ncbi:unnamed protein product [Cochlearia groenlandica]